jgi:uncharacterized protein YwqG
MSIVDMLKSLLGKSDRIPPAETKNVGTFRDERTPVAEGKLNLDRAQMEKLIAEIQGTTTKPVIRMDTVSREMTALTDSKFGGYPYWPDDREYPVNARGEKLILLAQINLADLKGMRSVSAGPGGDSLLPDSGILQFYIDCDDRMGLDEEMGSAVVYHREADPGVTEESVRKLGIRSAADLVSGSGREEYFPLDKCIPVTFREDREFIGFPDADFEPVFFAKLKELYGIDVEDYRIEAYSKLYSFLKTEDYELLAETFNDSQGNKLLGYPYFTQTDPRDPEDVELLLFQMDSGQDIMWGDSGIGNFFIREEDLRKLDFRRVRYNWDCY